METNEMPGSGTGSDTNSSLELIHEEAEELSRSMDLSLAFWGNAREQPNMIPATKLKCTSDNSNKASELALIIWGKMAPREYEEVKNVETELLKNGEICADDLFSIVRNILEGVGLPLDVVLSDLNCGQESPTFVHVMAELLYLYNQNLPPEISESMDYENYVKSSRGTSESITSENDSMLKQSENIVVEDFEKKINSLLEKAKELSLGEIKVPSSPHLTIRSKLSIVERQVKAKIRLKNIRKMIQLRREENNIKREQELKNKIHSAPKESNIGHGSTKQSDTKSVTESNLLGNRQGPLRSMKRGHDMNSNQADILQRRLKKTNQIRKKLAEEKQNKINHNLAQTKYSGPKIVFKNVNSRENVPGSTFNEAYPRFFTQMNYSVPEIDEVPEAEMLVKANLKNKLLSDISSSKSNEANEFYVDMDQNNDSLPFNSVPNMPEINEMLYSFIQNTYPSQIITSPTNIILKENNNSKYHSNIVIENDNLSSLGNAEALKGNNEDFSINVHSTGSTNIPKNDVELAKEMRSDVNGNITNNEQGTFDRPCSRQEMLTEMRKMLKEALTELGIPNILYNNEIKYIPEFKNKDESLTPEKNEIILRDVLEDTASQTTDSISEVPVHQDESTSCEQIMEETKVDIERNVAQSDDAVDIKIIQETALPNVHTKEKDRKVSTEVSVSQSGPGPAVKVSVTSTIKGNGVDSMNVLNRELIESNEFVGPDSKKVSKPEKVTDGKTENNKYSALVFTNPETPHGTPIINEFEILNSNEALSNEPCPSMKINNSSHLSQDTILLDDDEFDIQPINVNLAMIIQEYAPTVRDDLRPCGPFQMGGVLLADKLEPQRLEGDIGDGCDAQYFGQWNDSWNNHNFRGSVDPTPPYRLTESDSLYVNTSDDTLDGAEFGENSFDGRQKQDRRDDTRIEGVVNEDENTILAENKKEYISVVDVLSGLTKVVTFPLTFPFYLLKASIHSIFGRRPKALISDCTSSAN